MIGLHTTHIDWGNPHDYVDATWVLARELRLLRESRAFVEHRDGGPPPRSSAAECALVVRRIAELRSLAAS